MDLFELRLNQPLIKRIIETLPEDLPVYLVGGAIRDALLNRRNVDLDFVIAEDALQLGRKLADKLGGAYYPMDPERKVARIILKGEAQAGNPEPSLIKIDFSTFQGEDLLHDLQGRDFTINAMAVDIRAMEQLIDPLGGLADLIARNIRPCSQNSIYDDPVRILRAARFSVAFKMKIPKETLVLLRKSVEKIPSVSAERLRDELFRILSQPHPSLALRLLDKLEALEFLLPEICNLKGVQQSPPHTKDVWEHTLDLLARLEDIMEVLALDFNPERTENLSIGLLSAQLGRFRKNFIQHFRNALNPDRPHRGLIFLAGLYHDVGKVRTQVVDTSGRIRFIEHGQVGSEQVEERGRALRLSNLEIDRMVTIVKHHMRPSLLSHGDSKPSRKAIYRFFRDTGVAGVDICLISLADVMATYGPTLPQERWSNHLLAVREMLGAWWDEQEESLFAPPLISGDDLLVELRLTAGPLIGYLLENVREAQVAGEIKTRDEAIDLARKLLTSEK